MRLRRGQWRSVSYSPLIRQYLDVKRQYPDHILLFRVGDFYEVFVDDAPVVADMLESMEIDAVLTM